MEVEMHETRKPADASVARGEEQQVTIVYAQRILFSF